MRKRQIKRKRLRQCRAIQQMDPRKQIRYGRIKLRKSYKYHQSELAGGIFVPVFNFKER